MTADDIVNFKLACHGLTAISALIVALAACFVAGHLGYLRGPRGYPGRVGRAGTAGRCRCDEPFPVKLGKEQTQRGN